MKKVLFALALLLFTAQATLAHKHPKGEKPSAELRVEKRMQRLEKSLTLTAQQKEVLHKEMLRIEKERDELHLAAVDQKKQRRALREAEKALLEKTLSKEQQEQLKTAQKERAKEMKQRKSLPDAPAQKQAE
jgi:hypothetical protein